MVAAPLYMLMVLVRDEAAVGGARLWAAVELEGHGRTFTRAHAEELSDRVEPPRFLFAVNADSEQFAADSAPTLGMLPGETIWHYGEPLRADLLAVLQAAAGRPTSAGAEWPDRGKLPIPVTSVVDMAVEWFGHADAHAVEVYFDRLVADLGGFRHGEPPCYHVPLEATGAIQLRPQAP